jgi:UDP-N-acetylglucosamine transferase subunit ALG13
VIFFSTGTNEQAFDRLVRAAADIADGPEPVHVQYGSSTVAPGAGRWEAFLSFDAMREAMQEARAVVVHAGVGSILLAHRCGKRPIVVPRRHDLGEAVDDHQLALALRLQEVGVVTVVKDTDDLAAALEALEPLAALPESRADGLALQLRTFLTTTIEHEGSRT